MKLNMNHIESSQQTQDSALTQKQLIRQNRIDRNRLSIEVVFSILVLLASLLPFLNNILGKWFDLSKQVDNTVGVRSLDWDSSIYFLSIALCIMILALGGIFRANKYTFYACLISGSLHMWTYIKFIFFNQNQVSEIANIAMIVLIFVFIGLIFFLETYYSKLNTLNKFNNKTLDRFSTILFKRRGNE